MLSSPSTTKHKPISAFLPGCSWVAWSEMLIDHGERTEECRNTYIGSASTRVWTGGTGKAESLPWWR